MGGRTSAPDNADFAPRPGFPAEAFARLFSGCAGERHAAGRDLFLQGDEGDRVFGVLSGKLEIALISADGRKLVTNIETRNGLVGEIAALDGGPRSATVTCLSDCIVVSLSRAQLLDRLARDPALARDLIAHLCTRVRWMSGEVGDQALLTLEQRLAKRVMFLAGLQPEPGAWIMGSQQDIAEFIGATRETVNKALAEWRAAGLVDVGRGRLRVRDPAGLRRIAGSD